ncbi:MAG TPA: alpha-amylase family glycosyl hydrolase [Verrucomicrobiae bacterium]
MTAPNPLLYEINTRCLLTGLSRQLGRSATLRDIPDAELKRWQSLGFTHIWLMGVWPNGPLVRQHGLQQPSLLKRYRELLPDWQESDVGGSPYGISAYTPDPLIGGTAALTEFRTRLHTHGLRLILDFIPNHIGLDHPWIQQRPDLLIHSPKKQNGFFPITHNGKKHWIAHGKDPYFDPWTDTAQLNHSNPTTRHEMIKKLFRVAQLCDGVRCDMAMLVLNDIFADTWKHFSNGQLTLPIEFWTDAITQVRQQHPDFLFLAEAYWGRETQLQQLGFNFTYDKNFLDHVAHRETNKLQAHLHRENAVQTRSTHFLENHDEPRIAAQLEEPAQKAAALLWLALPGMKLLYEGQMEGQRAHLPVQLWRRPEEPTNTSLRAFYEKLFSLRQTTALKDGTHRIPESLPAWEGNPSHQNLFVIIWQKNADEFELIAVNYAAHRSQCRVRLEISTAAQWTLQDRLGTELHHRTREEIQKEGLYLDLDAWNTQWFEVRKR